MFQFPGLPALRPLRLQHSRFPHSDICGSKVVCTSPQLFAAYHVLRRLREPRHPPYALSCFLLFSSTPARNKGTAISFTIKKHFIKCSATPIFQRTLCRATVLRTSAEARAVV